MNLMMEKRVKTSKVTSLFFIVFFIFTLIQFISPILLDTNHTGDLSGLTAVSDNEELIETLPFPINAVYSFGDRLCHQKSERSFIFNQNQMPFCSRCTAIWLGMTIGLAFMIFYHILLNDKILILIILSLVPIGIDGVGQLVGFWESTNITRVITGLLVGIACGIAIGIIVDEFMAFLKRKTLIKD